MTTISTAPFDCLECGKHVGHAGRRQSPVHVLTTNTDEPDEQWSFCGWACAKAFTDRKHQENGSS
jgi:hypothetical protein